MDKYVFNTFDKQPKGFEKKSDAVKLETIGIISKLSPEALFVVKDVIRWAYQHTDQAEPDAMTREECDRYSLMYYAARAKIECVQEVLKWKRAVDYNFATGKHKPRPKAASEKGGASA